MASSALEVLLARFPHAGGTGGLPPLDFQEAVPACAELQHVADRSGRAPAGDLHRLAVAPHLGRNLGGRALETSSLYSCEIRAGLVLLARFDLSECVGSASI